MKRILPFILSIIMTVGLLTIPLYAATYSFSNTKKTLTVGEKVKLNIIGETSGKTITFTSSDSNIVSVDKKGVVTAKSAGKAKVFAAIGKSKITRTFTVNKALDKTGGNDEKSSIKDISAKELVSKIKIGWNLGNTLDAGGDYLKGKSIIDVETAWIGGNKKVTTKGLFEEIKKAGFNAVRIPTTWGKFMDDNGNVDSKWMTRVKEVVDYAIGLDMYVILNTHHDNDVFDLLNIEKSKKLFKKVWEQISTTFKNYDEHLIFEGLNEPRIKENEWSGGTAEARDNINILNALFVKTVRTSGENNKYRSLMIPAYAASMGDTEINHLVLPDDDRIIISVHSYAPYNFALSDKGYSEWDKTKGIREITSGINKVYDKFVKNGIPVIIGEMGALNKDNTASRAAWAEYFVSYARSKDIPCFWWDNSGFAVTNGSNGENFGLIERDTYKWVFPEIRDALTA